VYTFRQLLLYYENALPFDLIDTTFTLTDIFDRNKFDQYIQSDAFDDNVQKHTKYAINLTTLKWYNNVYLQYMLLNNLQKETDTTMLPDSNIKQYQVIDQKLLNKYKYKIKRLEHSQLLSELSNHIQQGTAIDYVRKNNEQISNHFSHINIDPKYMKYLTMFGNDKSYNNRCIDYLTKLRIENPEYYQIVNFWIFGDYKDFNAELQKYEKRLTKNELSKMDNMKQYNEYYKSVVLSEFIYKSPKPTHQLITYRGVDEASMPRNKYPIGEYVVLTRFTSVTPNYNVTHKFSEGENCVITVIIPANAICINLVTSEDEIVLPRYSIVKHVESDVLMYIGYNLIPITNKSDDGLISGNFVSVSDELTDQYEHSVRVMIDKASTKQQHVNKSMDDASSEGDIMMLDEFLQRGRRLKYTNRAMDEASTYGKTDVLEWWKNSGVELKYSEKAIDNVSTYGYTKSLEWWKNSGLELKYTDLAMDDASMFGQIEVLNWWKESELELKYSEYAMDQASMFGRIEVLNWWKESGLDLKYSEKAIVDASAYGNVKVLEWWKKSGLKLKYSEDAMIFATKYGNLDVLEWWKNSELKILYPRNILDDITDEKIRNWWNESGLLNVERY
jgi:hypothetical protein